MSKVQDYWDDLAKQARAKGLKKTVDDVERAWRQTEVELGKEGIKPDNPRYRQMLINRTREKVMKESKFEQYLIEKEEYLNENEKYLNSLKSKLENAMSDGSFKTPASWGEMLKANEDDIREIIFKIKGLQKKKIKGKFSDITTYGIKVSNNE